VTRRWKPGDPLYRLDEPWRAAPMYVFKDDSFNDAAAAASWPDPKPSDDLDEQ